MHRSPREAAPDIRIRRHEPIVIQIDEPAMTHGEIDAHSGDDQSQGYDGLPDNLLSARGEELCHVSRGPRDNRLRRLVFAFSTAREIIETCQQRPADTDPRGLTALDDLRTLQFQIRRPMTTSGGAGADR